MKPLTNKQFCNFAVIVLKVRKKVVGGIMSQTNIQIEIQPLSSSDDSVLQEKVANFKNLFSNLMDDW